MSLRIKKIVERLTERFSAPPCQTSIPQSRGVKIALLCVLAAQLFSYNSQHAEAEVRVARTLRLNQSIAILSHRCALSVLSKTPAGVTAKCSKAITNRFKKRPKGRAYLGPQQTARIKSQGCSLQILRESAGEIRVRCELPPSPTPTPVPQRQIGGTITGLNGTIVLQYNGAENLSISSNGIFNFTTTLAEGSQYSATVLTQPTDQTCTVTNGSGSVGSANVTNISVLCALNPTTLTSSVSTLALSVTGLTEYGVGGTPSSGLPRVITVTNTGSAPALNLVVTQPTFPSGTTSSSSCGTTLTAGSSCSITITPGNTATSACTNGTAPTPNTIAISADNATTVSANVVILGYGCIYQGGHVFAFDDTTPTNGSVGGKVLTTTDQAAAYPNGVVWSSNGGIGGGSGGMSLGDTSADTIPGISEISTVSSSDPSYAHFAGDFTSMYSNPNPFSSSDFASCAGATDGACNTTNIVTFYNQFITNNTFTNGGSPFFTASPGPTNLSYYAAGLCRQTIASFNDWYLPAICELGHALAQCGASGPDTTQNVQSNLVELNALNLLSGYYWSSTEDSATAIGGAMQQYFAAGGGSFQSDSGKQNLMGVRCARNLTT